MSDEKKPERGTVGWLDLTVENAEEIRACSAAVVGSKSDSVDMGEYQDFVMTTPESGSVAAGVCHARGSNADLPSQWLVYVNVDDLDASSGRCTELGGEILAGPKTMGSHGRYCVIRDPAGAVVALFEPAG